MERELAHWVERLRERAEAEGLSFPPVAFQEVGPEEMAMLAAYGGFPRRYPHWRWGSAYLHYRETYRYGLARIYERKLTALEALKKSLLHQAFTGLLSETCIKEI
mgnify:CR=1 FL=1